MASVKVKFRPSTVNGREGTLYYQVIHNRVVRQINTEYKLFVSVCQRLDFGRTEGFHPIIPPFRNGCLTSYINRTRAEQLSTFNRFTHQVGQGQAEQDYTCVIPVRHICDG